MSSGITKLGFTAYAHIGTDAVRVSIARNDSGEIFYVREDGTNAPVLELPKRFLTSGHVVNSMAKLGYAANAAALPWNSVLEHEWKEAVTLRQLGTRKSFTNWTQAQYVAIRDGLLRSYELGIESIEDEAIAA